jgi:hypothetical protein
LGDGVFIPSQTENPGNYQVSFSGDASMIRSAISSRAMSDCGLFSKQAASKALHMARVVSSSKSARWRMKCMIDITAPK